MPKLYYNRVDGLHGGFSGTYEIVKGLSVVANGGRSRKLKRWSRGLGAKYAFGKNQRGWVKAHYQERTATRYNSETYSRFLNSLQMLSGFDDYFDYYWNEQVQAEVGYELERPRLKLILGVQHEEHSALEKNTDFAFVRRHRILRPNPAIEEGRLRSAQIGFQWGGDYVPFGVARKKRVSLKAEYSDNWMDSDFSFAKYELAIDWQIETFLRRRQSPNALNVHIVGGYATGDLPLQRFGILDASVGPFTPFGTFRTLRDYPYEGEHYVAVFWEHNFRSAPFEMLGLWGLASRGFGLALHGAVGRTWIDSERQAALGYVPRYVDGYHHEVGLTLQIYHALRMDLTRRLDRGGWYFGVSLAYFDVN